MPGKGKKKGKGKGGNGKEKGKGKGKGSAKDKKAEGGANLETKKLLKTYERNCLASNSQQCPGIRKLLKAAAEFDKVVTKVRISYSVSHKIKVWLYFLTKRF